MSDTLNRIDQQTNNAPLKIVTNVMTPDGRRVCVAWLHTKTLPVGQTQRCMVLGHNLDEALRKVEKLEDDFVEAAGSGDQSDSARSDA